MPKKSTSKHPIARLRRILKATQRDFGLKIGYAEITIRSVEQGKRPLSKKMRGRISTTFNVDPKCLDNLHKPLLDRQGHPYTRESFFHTLDSMSDKRMRHLTLHAMRQLDALLSGAGAPHHRKFQAVLMSFCDWIEQARTDFNMEDTSKRIYSEKMPNNSIVTFTIRDIHRILSWEHLEGLERRIFREMERSIPNEIKQVAEFGGYDPEHELRWVAKRSERAEWIPLSKLVDE